MIKAEEIKDWRIKAGFKSAKKASLALNKHFQTFYRWEREGAERDVKYMLIGYSYVHDLEHAIPDSWLFDKTKNNNGDKNGEAERHSETTAI